MFSKMCRKVYTKLYFCSLLIVVEIIKMISWTCLVIYGIRQKYSYWLERFWKIKWEGDISKVLLMFAIYTKKLV